MALSGVYGAGYVLRHSLRREWSHRYLLPSLVCAKPAPPLEEPRHGKVHREKIVL